MEAVVSLAMTEWRRPGLTDAVVAEAGAGTEKVAEAARSPGARSRTRSSSVSGPGSAPLAGMPRASRLGLSGSAP
ncbi:hypothetical protein H0E86_12295 [Streptomyces sp. SCSIO-PteL053]|nr:hypothetical protein H0E86_12295 [Streptomyces sp. SCSIO-PteL053]